jgi:hypothetical protein
MKRSALISLAASALLLSTGTAQAYLDPGAGSMLLQALVGGLAAGFAVISMYFQRIKALFKRLFSKSATKPEKQ